MKIVDNIRKNAIILLLITIIVLYIVLKDDFNDIVKAFEHIDYKFILVALLFYLLSVALRGYVNYLIINDTNKVSLREAIKHNMIAQFFNGITPFSTGGQPMEVYMLTEHKIHVLKATNITIQGFIFYQIALVICGVLAVLYNFIFHIFPKVKLLQHLVLLGFLINIAVVVGLLLICYSKRITRKLSKLTIKICRKLKIKVDEDDIKQKFEDYYKGFRDLEKKKRLVISGILLNIASLLCLYIVPLFVLYALGDFTSMNVSDTLTAAAYVYVVGAFVPVPGASGGIEYAFTQFYGNFIAAGTLYACLLIWRFITYYLGVIIGGLLFSLERKVK